MTHGQQWEDFNLLKRFLAGTAATLALSLTSVGFGQGLTGTETTSGADALFSQGLQDRTGWENWFSSARSHRGVVGLAVSVEPAGLIRSGKSRASLVLETTLSLNE
jgi:hypothetical protein